ncbi:sec1 family domain-containing protein 2-like [Clavelina lepadiformis]|uniref:sec1 family domain-containing protein 2-like n=1 Tax=Clavelina lepadiformis TaxID=159417 RepID=UPI00404226B1
MENSWIKEARKFVWNKVTQKVKHAVVFIDASCAECLFWSGGPTVLFSNGALEIKDFSSFENGSVDQKKAVFLVSSVLRGETLSILEDIIKTSNFDYCVIITTVDADTHKMAYGHAPGNDSKSVFDQCEENACMWMGDMNYTCEVFHVPVFMSPCTNCVYLTPSLNNLFPLITNDLCAIDSVRRSRGEKHSIERLSDVHFFSLPVNFRVQVKKLVTYFNSLFESLNCKEELFAVGHTSRLVATQLTNSAQGKQRRKQALNTSSLLLIDRSLDSIQAVQHSDQSLVDKILGILPELAGHHNNISVDMLRLTTAYQLIDGKMDNEELQMIRESVACPGCLCPPDDACPLLLEEMIKLPQKEALKSIKRGLLEAAVEEGLDVAGDEENLSFSDEIYKIVEKFNGNSGAIMYNNNLLQLSMAAAQCLSDDYHEKWERLGALEKLLTLDDDPVARIVQVMNEVDDDGNEKWSVDDVLQLLVFASSLHDPSNTSDEVWDDVSSSLSLMISERSVDDLPEGLLEVLGMNQSEDNSELELDQVQDAVEEILEKLRKIYPLRSQLSYLKDLRKESFGPPKYEPLLVKLLKQVFDPSRPDLHPDVEHISTGLMDLLKSGFSMFKKVSPPRPNDAKILCIFVIGGITFEEVRIIHEMVEHYNSSQKRDLQVLIGSNRITFPSDTIDRLLFANNLRPDVD